MSAREPFLAGDRPDDIALYVADSMLSGDADDLTEYGERVDDGMVLVVPGDQGRSLVAEVLDVDAMAFAQEAMGQDGDVAPDLTTGSCPVNDPDAAGHAVQFVFSFVEPTHEDVGGRYAEGPVVHAYAACSCGHAYSDRWTVDTDDT